MIAFDSVTRLVAGSAAAERSEYKRLDRKYKDAEANLKLITKVTRGSPITSSSNNKIPNSGLSNDVEIGVAEARERVARSAMLERSQSTPTVSSFAESADLDELKRTTSVSSLTESRSKFSEMTGFGNYRRAASASIDWQVEMLERKLRNDGDIIVNFLGETPPMGIEPEAWQKFRARQYQRIKNPHSRTPSFASNKSSSNRSRSSPVATTCSPASSLPRSSDPPRVDASSLHVDGSGTVIVRGFAARRINTPSPPNSIKRNMSEIKLARSHSTLGFQRTKKDMKLSLAQDENAVGSDDEI